MPRQLADHILHHLRRQSEWMVVEQGLDDHANGRHYDVLQAASRSRARLDNACTKQVYLLIKVVNRW